MGTARPGATIAPVTSPLADDKAAWGFLLGECGRTIDEVYMLCACGDLGIDFAKAVRGVMQRGWLLGGHGPANKPERELLPQLLGSPESLAYKSIEPNWPRDLLPFAVLGNQIVDLVRKADELVQAAKAVIPVLEKLESSELSRLQHEGQMMCVSVLLGAEMKELKQPTSMEMACIVALLGQKLQVPEMQPRFANAEARAEVWEKQIRKAKRELLPMIRRLGLFPTRTDAPATPEPAEPESSTANAQRKPRNRPRKQRQQTPIPPRRRVRGTPQHDPAK